MKGDTGKVLLDVLVSGCPVAEQTVAGHLPPALQGRHEPEVTLTKVEPVWLEGLTPGKHAYVVGLTRDQKVVPGAFALYQGSFEVESLVNPGGAGVRAAREGHRPVNFPAWPSFTAARGRVPAPSTRR